MDNSIPVIFNLILMKVTIAYYATPKVTFWGAFSGFTVFVLVLIFQKPLKAYILKKRKN